MKLNVTTDPNKPMALAGRDWVGYLVLNGRAVQLVYGGLDSIRTYAERQGYTGILIGSPSVPWAQDVPVVTVG